MKVQSNHAVDTVFGKSHTNDNQVVCHQCRMLHVLGMNNSCIDGFHWHCPGCRTRKSVRQGSFFAKSHLPIWKVVMLLYFWANDEPQDRVCAELSISPRSKYFFVSFAYISGRTFVMITRARVCVCVFVCVCVSMLPLRTIAQ